MKYVVLALILLIAAAAFVGSTLGSSVQQQQAPVLTEERLFSMVGRLHAQVELLTERVNMLQQENDALRKQLEPTP